MTCYFIAMLIIQSRVGRAKQSRGILWDVGGGVGRCFSEEANVKPLSTEASTRRVGQKVMKRAHGTRGYLL